MSLFSVPWPWLIWVFRLIDKFSNVVSRLLFLFYPVGATQFELGNHFSILLIGGDNTSLKYLFHLVRRISRDGGNLNIGYPRVGHLGKRGPPTFPQSNRPRLRRRNAKSDRRWSAVQHRQTTGVETRPAIVDRQNGQKPARPLGVARTTRQWPNGVAVEAGRPPGSFGLLGARAWATFAFATSFRRNGENGGADRDRTDDLVIANDALSQLSYGPILARRDNGSAVPFCQAAVRGNRSFFGVPARTTMPTLEPPPARG